MSRHEMDEQASSNPATLRLTWSSSESGFKAYNTVTKIKSLLTDVQFAIIDETVSICGFHEGQNLGIFSNEIKNIKNEPLSVRTKNGVLIEGLYADIKPKWGNGPTFAKNVYVKLKTGEIGVIQLSGAALKQYFDFAEANKGKMTKNWIRLDSVLPMKKGSVNYNVPVFGRGQLITKAEDALLEEDYKQIKAYQTPKVTAEMAAAESMGNNTDVNTNDIPY